MEEQRLVASHCKENPKIFWKYVNSKRKICRCDHIGDLITDDKEGNTVYQKLAPILKKAEVLGNFFASVFVRETHYDPPNSQPRPFQSSFSDPIFSEQVIFDKLKNLNVITKSPGPDSIHPRILYELRIFFSYASRFREGLRQSTAPTYVYC